MIASFHLVHYRRRSILNGLARVETDRLALGRVDGLRFSRLLLSTPGPPERPVSPPTPHPNRSALLAVWEDETALDAFLQESPVVERWRVHGKETWHVRLEPLHSHGTCDGKDPLEGLRSSRARAEPAVTVTYVTLRNKGLVPFFRIFPKVRNELVTHPGFRGGIFLSEGPPHTYYRNFTFSIWSSLDQAMNFGYQRRASVHAEAMRRVCEEVWHHEFWFARFRPYASAGTWSGRNPLQTIQDDREPVAAGQTRRPKA